MTESRCQQIEKILRQKLRSMQPGEKIPTEMELCAEFSVSRMTMNKVIGKLVDDDLLYRIKKKGTFVKERRTADRPIYFLIPVIDFFTYDSSRDTKRILHGLNSEASLRGRKIELLPVTRTNQLDDYDWETLDRISSGDQVFVTGFWYRNLFPFLKERECEVVCADPDTWLEPEYRKILSSWYSIKIARKAGVENVVSYLAGIARKNPVFFYRIEEKEHPATEGFKSGLAKAGIPFGPERFIYIDDLPRICSSFEKIYKRTRFDSIVAAYSGAAKAFCSELARMKLSVPDDISVISLEEAPDTGSGSLPVTALATPFEEVGREAARIFQREVFLPGETRLHQLLIERESTRKGAGSALHIDFSDESRTPEALLRFGTDGI